MKLNFTLLAAFAMTIFSAASASAGSQAYSCSDASGSLTYDGSQLTFRSSENGGKPIDVTSKKLSDTPLATIEEICTNKVGQKFVAGSKTSLLVLEYPQSWDQKLVQGQFLCVEEYDSYPNMDGVDTKCVKKLTRTERLRDTTLVTETKNK